MDEFTAVLDVLIQTDYKPFDKFSIMWRLEFPKKCLSNEIQWFSALDF